MTLEQPQQSCNRVTAAGRGGGERHDIMTLEQPQQSCNRVTAAGRGRR
jgi:hypothetical protein